MDKFFKFSLLIILILFFNFSNGEKCEKVNESDLKHFKDSNDIECLHLNLSPQNKTSIGKDFFQKFKDLKAFSVEGFNSKVVFKENAFSAFEANVKIVLKNLDSVLFDKELQKNDFVKSLEFINVKDITIKNVTNFELRQFEVIQNDILWMKIVMYVSLLINVIFTAFIVMKKLYESRKDGIKKIRNSDKKSGKPFEIEMNERSAEYERSPTNLYTRYESTGINQSNGVVDYEEIPYQERIYSGYEAPVNKKADDKVYYEVGREQPTEPHVYDRLKKPLPPRPPLKFKR